MLEKISFEKCGNVDIITDETTITIISDIPIKLETSNSWLSIVGYKIEKTTDEIIEEYLKTSSSCIISGYDYGIIRDCYTREIKNNDELYLYVYCPSKYTCEIQLNVINSNKKHTSLKTITENNFEFINFNSCSIVSNNDASIYCKNHSAKLNGNKLTIITNIEQNKIIISPAKFTPFDPRHLNANIINIENRILKKINCYSSVVKFHNDIFQENLVISANYGKISFDNIKCLKQVLISITDDSFINLNDNKIDWMSINAFGEKIQCTISNFILNSGGFIHASGKCNIIGKLQKANANAVKPVIVSYSDITCNIKIDELD